MIDAPRHMREAPGVSHRMSPGLPRACMSFNERRRRLCYPAGHAHGVAVHGQMRASARRRWTILPWVGRQVQIAENRRFCKNLDQNPRGVFPQFFSLCILAQFLIIAIRFKSTKHYLSGRRLATHSLQSWVPPTLAHPWRLMIHWISRKFNRTSKG